MSSLSREDRWLINALQDGIAVNDHPFANIAEALGESEDCVAERIQRLLDDGVLSRFGPMFDAERMGGAFSLCAMSVPAERFDDVMTQVNAHVEVAHNYERTHKLNMWFVLASDRPERIAEIIRDIELESGLQVLNLPKCEEFYVGLKFTV